jgi:hypothetical protein
MNVSITLSQVQSIIDDQGTPKYRVANQISATENLTLALFVNDVDPDAYSHIASPYDLESYPEDRNAAIDAGLDFYRRSDATRDFTALDEALYFAAVVRQQLAYLAPATAETADAFPSTTTYVFTS